VIQPLRTNGCTFLGSVLRSIPIAFAKPLNVAPRLRQIATRTVNCVTRSPLAASEESKKRVTTRETCRTLVQMQVASIVAQAASSDTRERLVGGIGSARVALVRRSSLSQSNLLRSTIARIYRYRSRI